MIEATEFAYAQARLQARHGARPDEAAWRAIDGAVTLGRFVENVRATALASSLDFFRPTTSIHEAEQALRSAWRSSVLEAARWVPQAWRSAVQWLASATELPILVHLQRGEPPPDWLGTDPVSRRALEQRLTAPVIDAWIAQWRSRWSRTDADTREALEALIALVRRHQEKMRRAESAAAGRVLRQELRLRLAHSLHMYPQTSVALIAHLLLVALDLERLREGLVRRMVSR